jgi:predicted transcriptional regulator of viral defense system
MEERLLNQASHYLTHDYLIELYKELSQPRNKIKNLVNKGDLIPIKRELYILGAKYKRNYSKESLANIIYGPSVISFEYALAFHNLIPERVETLTSICFKRNKKFTTPVGIFTYRYFPEEKFSIGIELRSSTLGNFFIATAEKALCDLLYFQNIERDGMIEYLRENLRIDMDDIKNMKTDLLMNIADIYKKPSVMNLVKTQIALKGK